MRICLISPPTVTEFSERQMTESEALRVIAEHAPLGILSLAAVLEGLGCTPHVVDLNLLYYDYINGGDGGGDRHAEASFFSCVASHLRNLHFDVFGFSTICSSYPLTLRLAREVKRAHREATIILGGPQASVVDVPSLEAFPFVDYIVRGEAEETLPRLLDAISGGGASGLSQIGGITYRLGGDVKRNPNAPPVEDLDGLPMPAFHLYPRIKECNYVPLEAGRGCPFACSFCSTNDFFRRRFRMKSPQILVEQMKLIKEKYGISSFDLVHDMFTVDRKKVTAFCEAVGESGETFSWSCSARTDCVDDELLSRMARAGCAGIFFGIDTGSAQIQEAIDKRLNLVEAPERIVSANRCGMKTTVSLIAGFPEETKEDLRATIKFYGESMRHEHVELQLHLLAPLAETPITTRYKERLVYDDIFSDISFQGWQQDPEDREMIVSHRDIFTNFYAVPTRHIDRRYLMELREFLIRAKARCGLLLLLLHQDAGDLMRVFDDWRAWRAGAATEGYKQSYYASVSFARDLLDFVRTRYVERSARYPRLVAAMAELELASLDILEGARDGHERASGLATQTEPQTKPFSVDAVPRIADGVRVLRVNADYGRLIKCLREKGSLDRVPTEPVSLALLRAGDKVKVLELKPRTYELLCSCDGSRSLINIAEGFSAPVNIEGVPPVKVGLYGLLSLHRQGLIDFRAAN